MFELLPIIIIGLVFAGISEKQSKKIVNDSGIVYYEKKDVVFYLIAVVVLATFVGLRKVYNDTGVYIDQYNSIELTGVFPNFLFNDIDWNISSNFGFTIIMRLLKFLHFSDQSFLMFFAFFIFCRNISIFVDFAYFCLCFMLLLWEYILLPWVH